MSGKHVLPIPPPRCVAHGNEECERCSLVHSWDLDETGCKYCSTFGPQGMHWDTCQARIR